MDPRATRETHTVAFRCLLAAGLLALIPLAAVAADPVGRVIMSTGRVAATDANGFERTLSRNDVVFPGDAIETGGRGRAQIRFEDEGLVDLKPETRFAIDEYRSSSEERGGVAVFSFFKGALRTISGLIGLRDDDEYRMNTSVATIGIRGTEYLLQSCGDDCVAAGNERGIYGRVTAGEITAANDFGREIFEAGQYFFTPPDAAPRLLLIPPAGILDGVEDGRTGQDEVDEEETLGGADAEEQEDAVGEPGATDGADDGRPGGELVAGGPDAFESGDTGVDANTVEDLILPDSRQWLATGLSGEVVSDSSLSGFPRLIGPVFEDVFREPGTSLSSQQFVLNASGSLASMRLEFSDGSSEQFDFTGMTLTQAGSDFGVDWGLLTGSWESIVDDGAGVVDTTTSDTGGVAFAFTDSFTSPAQLTALEGSLAYSIAAGPDAVDAFGNLWAVNQLDIAVDFTNGTADLAGFDVSDSNDTISTTGLQPLVLDPSLGVLYVDRASPITGSWSGSSGSGSAEIVLSGFFVRADGSVMNVAFTADQLDSGGLPINIVSGLKLLQGQ